MLETKANKNENIEILTEWKVSQLLYLKTSLLNEINKPCHKSRAEDFQLDS